MDTVMGGSDASIAYPLFVVIVITRFRSLAREFDYRRMIRYFFPLLGIIVSFVAMFSSFSLLLLWRRGK